MHSYGTTILLGQKPLEPLLILYILNGNLSFRITCNYGNFSVTTHKIQIFNASIWT